MSSPTGPRPLIQALADPQPDLDRLPDDLSARVAEEDFSRRAQLGGGDVENLRGKLPFMKRVGPDVSVEIEFLRGVDAELLSEKRRLEANGGRLGLSEEQAVQEYEHIDAYYLRSDRAVSGYYARKVDGLRGSVEVELRARLAAVLYARIKPARNCAPSFPI